MIPGLLIRAKVAAVPNYGQPSLVLKSIDGEVLHEELVAAGFKDGDVVVIRREELQDAVVARVRRQVLALMEPGHYYDWREIAGLVARADGESPQRVKIAIEQLVLEGQLTERRSETGRMLGVEKSAAQCTAAVAHCIADDPARPE